MKIFSLIGAWIASAQLMMAGLTFDATSKVVNADADSDVVFAIFDFENKSKEEVVVADYHTPCTNCLSLELLPSTMSIAPGAKGKLRAKFKTGTFSGTAEKTITIWLKGDPKAKPSVVLKVKVVIPQLIKLTPRRLNWTIGEKPATKVLTVEVNHSKPIQLFEATCTQDVFKIEKKVIKPGFKYEFHVTPKSTEVFAYGLMRAGTDSKNPKFKRVQSYLIVKKGAK